MRLEHAEQRVDPWCTGVDWHRSKVEAHSPRLTGGREKVQKRRGQQRRRCALRARMRVPEAGTLTAYTREVRHADAFGVRQQVQLLGAVDACHQKVAVKPWHGREQLDELTSTPRSRVATLGREPPRRLQVNVDERPEERLAEPLHKPHDHAHDHYIGRSLRGSPFNATQHRASEASIRLEDQAVLELVPVLDSAVAQRVHVGPAHAVLQQR